MITAIEGMARALGKTTIAEGVETDEQLGALREIGCDLIQGFLTGRPQPLAAIIDKQTARAPLAGERAGSHQQSLRTGT